MKAARELIILAPPTHFSGVSALPCGASATRQARGPGASKIKGATGPQKYVVPHHSYPDSADPAYINSRDLANTSMEAYVQPTSCIVCHAYAVPWGATFICDPKGCSDVSKFQAFTFLLKYAQPPQAPPRAKRTD